MASPKEPITNSPFKDAIVKCVGDKSKGKGK